MHQWVRAGTKTSSFRINNGGGALLEIDLPHCSKKGTGTQRIREGGWMGVCVLERWERLAAITAASIVVAAAAVAGLPVAVHGLHCETRRFPAEERPGYNWPLLELPPHCYLGCKFLC